jgi:nucleoside-diphosphate-sugar epimerase
MLILLTGHNGFLGRVLYQYFENLNCETKTLSKSSGDYKVKLDETIPEFNENFELVIHAAGLAHIELTNSIDDNIFNKVNVNGTLNLLKGLESSGKPKSFVFISSVSVYGQTQGSGISEYSELNASDPYGKSKIKAEKLVLDWCKMNNVVCTILRLPLLAGANPPGNLGEMIKGIKKGYYFNIARGRVQKSMVLASDVVQYVLKISEIGGIYNLTDGYHPTFNELSRIISFQLGRKFVPNLPLFFAKILAKIGDFIGNKFPINSNKLSKIMSPLTFDDSKARKAFAWNPSPVLEGFKIEVDA